MLTLLHHHSARIHCRPSVLYIFPPEISLVLLFLSTRTFPSVLIFSRRCLIWHKTKMEMNVVMRSVFRQSSKGVGPACLLALKINIQNHVVLQRNKQKCLLLMNYITISVTSTVFLPIYVQLKQFICERFHATIYRIFDISQLRLVWNEANGILIFRQFSN